MVAAVAAWPNLPPNPNTINFALYDSLRMGAVRQPPHKFKWLFTRQHVTIIFYHRWSRRNDICPPIILTRLLLSAPPLRNIVINKYVSEMRRRRRWDDVVICVFVRGVKKNLATCIPQNLKPSGMDLITVTHRGAMGTFFRCAYFPVESAMQSDKIKGLFIKISGWLALLTFRWPWDDLLKELPPQTSQLDHGRMEFAKKNKMELYRYRMNRYWDRWLFN